MSGDLIGSQGTVVVAIEPGRPGTASVRCKGTVETYIAYSDQSIPQGASVVVYDTRGGQTVDVSPVGQLPEEN